MHGRPRPAKGAKPDPAAEARAAQKASLYSALAGEVLSRRAAGRRDPESMALAAKLLELNPEVYTVWNFRKEAVVDVLDGQDREAAVAAAKEELALTERALMKNPKSYSTWHHRKWIVERRLTPAEPELALVGKLLDADERNFHGWGYRRWLVSLMGITADQELEYTHSKIEQNFSNYSAWHHRTTLIPKAGRPWHRSHGPGQVHEGPQTLSELCVASSGGPEIYGMASPSGPSVNEKTDKAAPTVPMWVLREELQLVQQAFFTEPEDQSGWFYHRWLLGAGLAAARAAKVTTQDEGMTQQLQEALEGEAHVCKDLLEEEPGSKWPMLTLARIYELQASLQPDSEEAEALTAEAHSLYGHLAEVDGNRRGYYAAALTGSARVTIAHV